jgi:hypothetical protein
VVVPLTAFARAYLLNTWNHPGVAGLLGQHSVDLITTPSRRHGVYDPWQGLTAKHPAINHLFPAWITIYRSEHRLSMFMFYYL